MQKYVLTSTSHSIMCFAKTKCLLKHVTFKVLNKNANTNACIFKKNVK